MNLPPAAGAKPLPRLPLFQSLDDPSRTELPPPARDHVRRIIAQCVADEGGSSSNLPTSCIPLVHQTVEDISKAILEGHWLDGLLALKDMRRKRVLSLDDSATPEGDNNTADLNEGRETPKPRHHHQHHLGLPKSFTTPGGSSPSPRRLRTPKLRGTELLESNTRALAELQRLLTPEVRSSASPTMDLLHLVITLVTPDRDPFIAYPSSNNNNMKCTFVKRSYVLPSESSSTSSKGEKVVDLVGVESWKCTRYSSVYVDWLH